MFRVRAARGRGIFICNNSDSASSRSVHPLHILEIYVHKHTDSLPAPPPPYTHTHTYMLGRMTAQLGCVRGARAGVVWSVCIRVCGRICGEVWAVCVCVYVCACVVWVCGLWRGPGESLLTAGMRKEPLCLLYSGGCAWTREHCPDPSLQHRRAHTHMHQVTHKLRGLLQVSSHTL